MQLVLKESWKIHYLIWGGWFLMIYFHVTQNRGWIFGFCVSIYNFGSKLVLLVSAKLFSYPCACVVLTTAALWVKLFFCSHLFAWRNKLRWRVVLRESFIKYNCSFLENVDTLCTTWSLFKLRDISAEVPCALTSSSGNTSAHGKELKEFQGSLFIAHLSPAF